MEAIVEQTISYDSLEKELTDYFKHTYGLTDIGLLIHNLIYEFDFDLENISKELLRFDIRYWHNSTDFINDNSVYTVSCFDGECTLEIDISDLSERSAILHRLFGYYTVMYLSDIAFFTIRQIK